MEIFKRILKYFIPYWPKAAIAVMFMTVYALTSGIFAYIIGPVMKHIFDGGESEELKIIPFDLFVIPDDFLAAAVPFAIIFVGLLKGVCSLGNTYFMGIVGVNVTRDIRNILFKHILHMPIDFFASTTTAKISTRIGSDVGLLQNAVGSTFPIIFREGLTIIVLATLVISIDWQLAIVAFVGFPVVIYPMSKMGKRMKKLTKKSQITIGELSTIMFEALVGVRIVKAFGMEKYEHDRFYNEGERMKKLQIKEMILRALSAPIMEVIGTVGFALTIWYATDRIGDGSLEPAEFMSFFAAVVMMYKPMKALNGVNLNIQKSIAAGERVFELLDSEIEKGYDDDAEPLDGLKSSIEFKDVSFSYGERKVIEGLNLKVNSGETVALVGSSGAGKSTIVNFIPRFYDVDSGAILIDGKDIRDVSLRSLRENIALISQHIVLFNDTIAQNISYGDKEKSMEDVEKAAKASNAYNFITKLPKGFDNVIGESGVKLSGGERQRLSIARAFLKNTPILIMDEATSSLDTESEREVQKGFENLMKDRTVFVIAHRLSTIINADKIIVLSDGKIVESGSHEDLLAKEGEYARLYNMQFKDSD